MKNIILAALLGTTAHAETVTEICDVAAVALGMPDDAHSVCVKIGTAAEDIGIEPLLAIAIARKESHFRSGQDGDGGRSFGPLQVVPYYHCPNKKREGCDLIAAGVGRMFALQEVRKKTKPNRWHKIKPVEMTAYHIACHYKGGNRCGTKAKSSAYRVVRSMRAMRAKIKSLSEDPVY